MENELLLIELENFRAKRTQQEQRAKFEEHQNKATLVALTMIATLPFNPIVGLLFLPELGRQIVLREGNS